MYFLYYYIISSTPCIYNAFLGGSGAVSKEAGVQQLWVLLSL